MAIQEQVHFKFKVFAGSSAEDLGKQVQQFTAGSNYAAKSIGVEYLEAESKLLLSLGYRDDESGYPVQLLSRSAGTLDSSSSASLDSLGTAFEKAASSAGNVICHEMYVTGSGEVNVVFLIQG